MTHSEGETDIEFDSGGARQLKPLQILHVEDDPADALLIGKALRATNLPVDIRTASDGEEALQYLNALLEDFASRRPDLILLDLDLPRVTGHEVLAYLKSHPELRRIPVVVLSSSEAENDITSSYDRHANSYVVKPSGFAALSAAIERLEAFWFGVAARPRY